MPEIIPQGVTDNCPKNSFHGSYPANPRRFFTEEGEAHTSTFKVESKHEKLLDRNGVCFNVETVPAALDQHKKKPEVNRAQVIQKLQASTAQHYKNQEEANLSKKELCYHWERLDKLFQPHAMRLEAVSDTSSTRESNHRLVHVGANGFIMALITAFAQHLPLVLAPDDIWILISFAFATHVDQNAKALRGKFVQHEGEKRLLVETPISFAMSQNNNPDTGASIQEWETYVFSEFSSQIKGHIGEKMHQAIASTFTTTDSTAKAAYEVTLMSATKNYFSFGMHTLCGIPNITLLGTLEDWRALRERAEHLGTLMTDDFSNLWMPLLLPVLDEFVQSYQGCVNHGFWQSMVKLRHTGGGSGAHSFISGWIQILFPFVGSESKLSTTLRPWQEAYFEGPELRDFPPICSNAPVDWEYGDVGTFDLTFHAGILGFTQDRTTGALSPRLGWFVSHVPGDHSKQLHVEEYKKELTEKEAIAKRAAFAKMLLSRRFKDLNS